MTKNPTTKTTKTKAAPKAPVAAKSIHSTLTIDLPPSFTLEDPHCLCGWGLADAIAEPEVHAQCHCAVCGELTTVRPARVDGAIVNLLVCNDDDCGHRDEWKQVAA
jgi:hypothetical protein